MFLRYISILGSIFDNVTITLQLNSGQILYYYMDATWSVGLTWTYFTHPDYLVYKVGSMPPIYFLIPLIRLGHMFTFILIFSGGYMPVGVLCDYIIAMIDCSETA